MVPTAVLPTALLVLRVFCSRPAKQARALEKRPRRPRAHVRVHAARRRFVLLLQTSGQWRPARTRSFMEHLSALSRSGVRAVRPIGSARATSAPGLGSPLPHLRQDWAHPCHICAGTGLTHATSAPGLGSAAATSAPGLGSAAATSAPGLGSPMPHLRRDWAHPCHICAGTRLGRCHIFTGTPWRSAPRPHPPCPHTCHPLCHR
jgi:hypothetical protein